MKIHALEISFVLLIKSQFQKGILRWGNDQVTESGHRSHLLSLVIGFLLAFHTWSPVLLTVCEQAIVIGDPPQ